MPGRSEQQADLDDELRGWLQEAHDVVGLQADLPKRPPAKHHQPR
jgi:hypothetical protein